MSSSLQGLQFWEITVLEMKHTFLLTPQMPWSRGKGSYNPLLGLQWRETFRPRGSTSRNTFYYLSAGSSAGNGTEQGFPASARFLETQRMSPRRAARGHQGLGTGPGPLEPVAGWGAPAGSGSGRPREGAGRWQVSHSKPSGLQPPFVFFFPGCSGVKSVAEISPLPSVAEPTKSSRRCSRVRASRFCPSRPRCVGSHLGLLELLPSGRTAPRQSRGAQSGQGRMSSLRGAARESTARAGGLGFPPHSV